MPATSTPPPSGKSGLAYAIATGVGAGLLPVAPGTFGAIEGVALFLAFSVTASRAGLTPVTSTAAFVAINLLLFIVGVWAAEQTCKRTGQSDPGRVVVDEISGQLISLIPLSAAPSIRGLIAAFVLFRLFDIFKPYPIRKLENLHGGLGVMADDGLAGVYAGILVGLARYFGLI